jgi:hypothetical protein
MSKKGAGRRVCTVLMVLALTSCGGGSSPTASPTPETAARLGLIEVSVTPNPIPGVLGPDPSRILAAGDREYRWTVQVREIRGVGGNVVSVRYEQTISGAPAGEFFAPRFPRRLEALASLSVEDGLVVSPGYRLDRLRVIGQFLDDLGNRSEYSLTVQAVDSR